MDDRRHKNLVADALLPLINLLLYVHSGGAKNPTVKKAFMYHSYKMEECIMLSFLSLIHRKLPYYLHYFPLIHKIGTIVLQ